MRDPESPVGEPLFTIREAADVSTKTAAAIRAMVDRGELEAVGQGRRGKPRRIPRSALIQAGIFREDGPLPSALRSFQHQLTLFQQRLDSDIEGRLDQLELLQRSRDQDLQRCLDEFRAQLDACQRQIANLAAQLAENALTEERIADLPHAA